MAVVVLIQVDLQKGFFGHQARLNDPLADGNVLTQTVQRAARIDQAKKIVLVHPRGQEPRALLGTAEINKHVDCFAYEAKHVDSHLPAVRASRKWAMTAWRGGLGSSTCFDELFPAGALVAAMQEHRADSAYILRGEWCLHDPTYGSAVIAQHQTAPEQMKVCFTQAPPGLCGMIANCNVLQQLHEHQATFGNVLGYNPKKPHPDPIGREVNCGIPATVRDCARRFIYDTPRAISLLRDIASHLGEGLATAGAEMLADACRTVEAEQQSESRQFLPQQVTLELTPRRLVTGPITPQNYVNFERPDMDVDLAKNIVNQLGDQEQGGDVALLLGGLGDALLHPQWDQVVLAANKAGVLGIGIETDLLCDEASLQQLLELPIDVVTVRMNADTAEVYCRGMGADRFEQVIRNMQWLFEQRVAQGINSETGPFMPWIVPRLVKTPETLKDMESFFDRWKTLAGHAVIEPARSGCGLMQELSPVPMKPPLRRACAQVGRRMSILSDGSVALCDQDWQSQAALGDAKNEPLSTIWPRVGEAAALHGAEKMGPIKSMQSMP